MRPNTAFLRKFSCWGDVVWRARRADRPGVVFCVAGLAEAVAEVVVELAHRAENNEDGPRLRVSREFQFGRGGAVAVSLLGSRPRPALQLRQAMALSVWLFVGDDEGVVGGDLCMCSVEVGACRARLDFQKNIVTGEQGLGLFPRL